MNKDQAREFAGRLAADSVAAGDPVGWFERLYAAADSGTTAVPWADMQANPHLTGWLASGAYDPAGRTALVVGCGLGDDAELLAARGAQVTAFDVSPSAIAGARRRFPHTQVRYEVADLRQPPPAWVSSFDLVVEIYTLQALPATARPAAMTQLAGLVAPGGTLLIVTRLRDDDDPPGSLPWPLTAAELGMLVGAGLPVESWHDFIDDTEPGSRVRRLRATFTRRR